MWCVKVDFAAILYMEIKISIHIFLEFWNDGKFLNKYLYFFWIHMIKERRKNLVNFAKNRILNVDVVCDVEKRMRMREGYYGLIIYDLYQKLKSLNCCTFLFFQCVIKK